MGFARSTYYDQPARAVDETALVEAMFRISDEIETYGYRRLGAALRQQGVVVSHKKLRREDDTWRYSSARHRSGRMVRLYLASLDRSGGEHDRELRGRGFGPLRGFEPRSRG
jgi:hypothetical protein